MTRLLKIEEEVVEWSVVSSAIRPWLYAWCVITFVMMLISITLRKNEKPMGMEVKEAALPDSGRMCPKCGAVTKPGTAFCGKCGSALVSPEQMIIICPRCGKQNVASDAFCVGCGSPLAAGSNNQ